MKKKFKAREILSRDQMKKVSGSGYCSGAGCPGPMGATCQWRSAGGGCLCMKDGNVYGSCL